MTSGNDKSSGQKTSLPHFSIDQNKAADFFATGGGSNNTSPLVDNASQEISPGTVLQSRYTIQKKVGSGAMGTVFLAEDNIRGRELVLKVLHGQMSEDLKQKLQSEMSIYEQLNHEGIARTYDLGKDSSIDRFFITMEYIDGTPMDVLLNQAQKDKKVPPFDIKEVVGLFQKLTETLSYVHEKGFVHRDLKPSNLMVTSNNRIKILDFGIAKQLLPDSSHTGYVGTAVYMAPEQLRGGSAVSPAADVYSLGVILFQMLTGELFYGHMPGPAELLLERTGKSYYPPELDPVLLKSLQVFPEKRYQTAKEFFNAFRKAIEPKPIQMPTVSGFQAPTLLPQAPTKDPFAGVPKQEEPRSRRRRTMDSTSSNPPIEAVIQQTSNGPVMYVSESAVKGGRNYRSSQNNPSENVTAPNFGSTLTLAILSTLFSCMFGAVSIVFYSMANKAWNQGNFQKAVEHDRTSRTISYVCLGLVGFLVLVILILVGIDVATKSSVAPPQPPANYYNYNP